MGTNASCQQSLQGNIWKLPHATAARETEKCIYVGGLNARLKVKDSKIIEDQENRYWGTIGSFC